MNIDTKTNLESTHFRSTSRQAQTRLTQCLRNDVANIRPFSTPSEAIEAIKLGLNRVQPKNPGMPLIVGSRANAFDQPMINAILIYKARNGIIRTGKQLDNVIGRGTLAQLDNDLKAFGKQAPEAILGSTQWRFTFVGDNTAIFEKGKFFLQIASAQREDSAQFALIENSGFNQLGEFRGTSTGTFASPRATFAANFATADCTLTLTGANVRLFGAILMSPKLDGNGPISIKLPPFRNETDSDFTGTLTVRGLLSAAR